MDRLGDGVQWVVAMIDPTKTTPEKLAEMNDSLIVDNSYLRGQLLELRADNEALKQQVEQGKRDAVPEGWKLELDSSDIRVIDPNGERWRFRDLDDGGSGQFIFSFLKAMLVAAAPKQEK